LVTLSIIQQAQQQDAASQRVLFDAYGKILHRIARRYLPDKAKVDDAVANAIFIMLKKMAPCKFESIGGFESWIKKIVVNECLAILKREKPFEIFNEQLIESHYIDETIIENLTADEILRIISALPTGYRTIFNLFEIEGYTHQEIAGLLGISTGTSKSQLSKAKALLQKKIIELDPSYGKRKLV
jgi:RNA polymerase sigma-70 factor (ECF subfamily)